MPRRVWILQAFRFAAPARGSTLTFSHEEQPADAAALAGRVRFFVAGVPKAGTTALCQFLAQHPDVFMCPIKEPSFFAAQELLGRDARMQIEARALDVERWLAGETSECPRHGFALEWRHYEALFRAVRSEHAIGEGSVTYWWAPEVPRRIRERFPDARFVLILRNPAERLLSEYRAMRWLSPLRKFGDVALGLQGRESWGGALDSGRYATHLQRFFAYFAREQFSIHLYEDFCANPRAVCRDIFAFLGVDPDRPVDVSMRANEPRLPRWPALHAAVLSVGADQVLSRWLPQRWRRYLGRVYLSRREREVMSPADRRALLDIYRDEIRLTAELVGRDLSSWLR